jgi:hypothetical protein
MEDVDVMRRATLSGCCMTLGPGRWCSYGAGSYALIAEGGGSSKLIVWRPEAERGLCGAEDAYAYEGCIGSAGSSRTIVGRRLGFGLGARGPGERERGRRSFPPPVCSCERAIRASGLCMEVRRERSEGAKLLRSWPALPWFSED